MHRVLVLLIVFGSIFCLLILAIALLNINAGQPTQDSWPMFRHDPAHIGFSTSTVPCTNQTLWKQPTSGQIWSSPAVANGVVYVGSFDHNIYALNASTGVRLWNFTTANPVFSSPTIAGDKTYIASDDNHVYALDAQTGIYLWSYKTGAEVQSSAAVSDGIVYIGSNDTNIYALNASTGAKVWNHKTDSYVASSPAVVNDIVYVGSFDNNTYALNATTGNLLWNTTTGYDICLQSSLAVHGDILYTGSSHTLSFYSKGYIHTGSAVGSIGENIYALNATTGTILWNYTTGGGVWSSPAVANGIVYVGSGDNKLYALDAQIGTIQWSYKTNGAIYSSPAIVDGVVYVGSTDNNVYAIGSTTPATGSGVPLDTYLMILTVLAAFFVAIAVILIILCRQSK